MKPIIQTSTKRNVASLLLNAGLLFAALQAFAVIDSTLQMQLGNPSGATADTNNHSHYLSLRTIEALDYNDSRGQPNWASWDLTSGDANNAVVRQDSYASDTNLPGNFYHVGSSEYSGSGYDRGHLCPSADRTDSTNDNNLTFLMSNMMPQAPDNNRITWNDFEGYCRTLADAGNEVLIYCGPSGFNGSHISSSTHVLIPSNTWKIVVVVPLGSGTALSRITTITNRVIAIRVPNTNGVSANWSNYITSAHSIELETGFNFFTTLPGTIASAFRAKIYNLSNPPPPSITSFTPTNGFANTNVVITGTNFNGTSVVKFNGSNAVFIVDSNTQITTTVPTNATTGTISVTTPSGTTNSVSTFVVGSEAPDLTLTASHSASFTQGDTGDTLTIVVTNIGNAASSGTVTVSNSLPSGLTATAISGTGWSATLGTLTATRSDALSGNSAYPAITITVNVATNAPASVTNIVTVSGGGEINTANDTVTDAITINSASAPSATTTAASAVSTSSATLNGTVNPNGQPTTVQFEYGTTTGYGSVVAVAGTLTGTSGQSVNANISGLVDGTLYHFRVTASNIFGTVNGLDQTFTTQTNLPSITYAGTLVGWDVSGSTDFGISPLPPTTNAANLTVVGLTRGAGVYTNGTGANRAWGGVAFTNTTSADAIASSQFVTFTLTADPGYKLSCYNLSKFDYRHSATGATNGLVQYQIGSGPFTDIAAILYPSNTSAGGSQAPIDLSTISDLQNIGDDTSVTFRIVNWGGTSSVGTWYVFDVANNTSLDFTMDGLVVATNAVNTGAVYKITSFSLNNPMLPNQSGTFVWETVSNRIYNIERSDIITGGWTTFKAGLLAKGTNLTYTTTVPFATNFFRVNRQP